MKNEFSWVTILVAGVAVLGTWLTMTELVVEPLRARLEIARENVKQAMLERDQRLEYLQKQIDQIELACKAR